MSKPKSPAPLLIVFCAFFFLSGSAGLIYEVLWIRQFGRVMGNTTVSLSAVLTAFMAGLAIGSWLGGRLSDRRRDHLRLYGILEIVIGLYCLAVPYLILAIQPLLATLYRADPNGAVLPAVRFLCAIAIMTAPSVCMGATLPILIRHFTVSRDEVGERVGLIYGINTFGAVLGALMAGIFMIPGLGMRMTNWVAAGLNIGVGLCAIAVSAIVRERAAAASNPDQPHAGASYLETSFAARMALLGICLSGIAAMIYQVAWTRMFALLIGSSTYAFSIVVMANIGGLATGGLFIGRWIDRTRRPLLFFGCLQALVAASCYLVARFSGQYPLFVLRLLEQRQGNYTYVLINEFAMVAFLIFVPTFLMGGMFPVVARVCARAPEHLGRAIGTVYAVNTVGAVIGSLTAALVLMQFFGMGATMAVAIGLNLTAALIAFLAEARPPAFLKIVGASAMLAAMAGLGAAPPPWDAKMMASGPFLVDRFDVQEALKKKDFLARTLTPDLLFYDDGIACTVSVLRMPGDRPITTLAVNGKTDASDHPGDMPTQVLCGHIGPLLRDDLRSAMVLGLGGGVTLAGILTHDSIQSVDVVEISSSVVEAVRTQFGTINDRALEDPRVNVIVADGRNHMLLSDKRYDLIVSEPSNPWIAGIVNLFTREFWEQCQERMTERGVFVQWMHSYNMSQDEFMMVVKTFCETMPNSSLWQINQGDFVLVSAKEPLAIDWNELERRIAVPKVNAHLAKGYLDDIHFVLTDLMATGDHMREVDAYKNAQWSLDDTSRLEFQAPRSYYEPKRHMTLNQVEALRMDTSGLVANAPPAESEWISNILAARQLTQEAAARSLAGSIDATGLLAEAIAKNPYDQTVGGEVISHFTKLGNMAATNGNDESALRWYTEAVKVARRIRFAEDYNSILSLHANRLLIAQKLGREEIARESRDYLEAAGRSDLFPK